MAVKIAKLELENVKRVKAVKLEPAQKGLTIVGGNNHQGKTSVLDAIAWALGGNRFKPNKPQREGSSLPPSLHIKLNNGLIVERKGKNGSLKVTDPQKTKHGQALLDSFVEEFALNLPKFMELSDKEKGDTLLRVIGLGDTLARLEKEEKEAYDERRTIGQIADQKEKFAKEQPYHAGAPKELVSVSELIKRQQDILAKNGENQRKRERAKEIGEQGKRMKSELEQIEKQIQALTEKREEAKTRLEKIASDFQIAKKTVSQLQDESTAEIEQSLNEIEETNTKVRQNMDKDKAETEAKGYRNQYEELNQRVEAIRSEKRNLLKNADLPLPELSVEEGKLLYKGHSWDGMSGSEQLVVATSIVQKLNPNCGFVLIDKLEQMDPVELKTFGDWLEAQDLQAIATRVSTGEECSIIIEDGTAIEEGYQADEVEGDEMPDYEEQGSEVETEEYDDMFKWEL